MSSDPKVIEDFLVRVRVLYYTYLREFKWNTNPLPLFVVITDMQRDDPDGSNMFDAIATEVSNIHQFDFDGSEPLTYDLLQEIEFKNVQRAIADLLS